MMKQLDKLRDLPTRQKSVFINAIAGAKGADTQVLATLINEGYAGYQKMNKAMADQASLITKVNSQLSSNKNQWDAITGTMTNTAAAAGEKLKPEFMQLSATIQNNILPAIQAFIEKHPKLVANMLKALAVFAGLAIAGGGLALMFSGVFRAVSMGIKVVSGLVKAIRFIGTAFKVLRIIMLANPVLIIITAIAVAAFLIYKYWGPIKAFFSKLWTGVKSIFKGAFEGVKNILMGPFAPAALLYKIWDKVGPYFLKAGANILTSLWNGIKSKAEWLYNKVKGVVQKIRDFFPFSPAKTGPLRDIHRIKLMETIATAITPKPLVQSVANALGGFARMNFRMASPLPATGGGGGTVHFHYNPTINLGGTATPQDVQNLASMGMREFERMMRMYQEQRQRLQF
jgi:hypothetical protein